MPTQSVNGTTLHYTQSGSGDDVVLLHGFPLDSRMWDAQIAALSARHRVTAPDLRGFGRSNFPSPFTMETMADDVHALLESIGALPCVLAGLSMGGYISIAYAKKYPADLRALILTDTQAKGDTPEAKENRQKMIDDVRKGGSKAVAEKMLPKLLAEGTLKNRPDIVRRLREMIENNSPQTIEYALVALRDRPDQTAFLPSIGVPTLIVCGESDSITPPAISEAMQKAIPNSEIALIKGAGHMSPMEQAEQVNRVMEQFLDRT